jgi:hypothetical protein
MSSTKEPSSSFENSSSSVKGLSDLAKAGLVINGVDKACRECLRLRWRRWCSMSSLEVRVVKEDVGSSKSDKISI